MWKTTGKNIFGTAEMKDRSGHYDFKFLFVLRVCFCINVKKFGHIDHEKKPLLTEFVSMNRDVLMMKQYWNNGDFAKKNWAHFTFCVFIGNWVSGFFNHWIECTHCCLTVFLQYFNFREDLIEKWIEWCTHQFAVIILLSWKKNVLINLIRTLRWAFWNGGWGWWNGKCS